MAFSLQVISSGKLQLLHRLHVSADSWRETAQQYAVLISTKDTEQMNIVVQLSDSWKDQLSALRERLRDTHLRTPNYEKASEKEIYTELMEWTNSLTEQSERYSGEELLSCQDSLRALVALQDSWVEVALHVFRRHPGPDGAPPRGREAMMELGRQVSELHHQLETRVNGKSGIHKLTMSLVGLMESWANKLRTAIGQSDTMQASDWLKLEKALFDWQSLAEDMLQNVSDSQSETAQKKPHVEYRPATESAATRTSRPTCFLWSRKWWKWWRARTSRSAPWTRARSSSGGLARDAVLRRTFSVRNKHTELTSTRARSLVTTWAQWTYLETEPDGERKEEDDKGQNQEHQEPLPHPQ
ncbi:hypothetical protein CRUP_028234, partial [Coryphaenoides rupestris]